MADKSRVTDYRYPDTGDQQPAAAHNLGLIHATTKEPHDAHQAA